MRRRNPRGLAARLIMIIAAMGLFAVGYYWGNRYQYSGAPPVVQGVLMRTPVELPAFTLEDAKGLPFTGAELGERWTLLAFGDLRQARGHLTVNRLLAVHGALAADPDLQAKVRIAVAAESQPTDLALDFSRLSSALHLVSGDAAELQRLRAALGDLSPSGSEAAAPGDGAPVYLIDPRGRLMALFPAGLSPDAMAADLSALAARPDLLDPAPND